jgi:hypothetical protein
VAVDSKTMDAMSQIIMERCCAEIAQQARLIGKTLPKEMSGKDALEIFASALENANDATWPKKMGGAH